MRITNFILLILFSSVFNAHSQDAVKVMPLQDLYGLVLAQHPVARQAQLLLSSSELEVLVAKGGFDPQLKSTYDGKQFDGKDYWRIWQSSLRIPVWNGVDVKAEYLQTSGKELDPMYQTPGGGVSSVGISVPLGQGLLLDARRAVLKQAGYMRSMLEGEQRAMLNKLLLQVNKDYMDWTWRYLQSGLLQEAVRLAAVRFEGIRYQVFLGESPAIDSVEALIELQNRKFNSLQADNDLRNARLVLSNHLWKDQGNPLELAENIIPDIGAIVALQAVLPALGSFLDAASNGHFDLLKLEAKKGQLNIERRWAAEKLRPKINLEYNFLSEGFELYRFGETTFSDWSDQNKIGLTFSTSLFLREERGKYGLAKIKSEQVRYETDRRRREIITEVMTSYNDLGLLKEQLNLQQYQVSNATLMLEGESNRFKEGESSIFLMNVRENALINSKLKLAELQVKYGKSLAQLRWASGTLDRP